MLLGAEVKAESEREAAAQAGHPQAHASQEFELACAFAEAHEKVPGLPDGPDPGGMRSDTQNGHGPGLDLRHEQ